MVKLFCQSLLPIDKVDSGRGGGYKLAQQHEMDHSKLSLPDALNMAPHPGGPVCHLVDVGCIELPLTMEGAVIFLIGIDINSANRFSFPLGHASAGSAIYELTGDLRHSTLPLVKRLLSHHREK